MVIQDVLLGYSRKASYYGSIIILSISEQFQIRDIFRQSPERRIAVIGAGNDRADCRIEAQFSHRHRTDEGIHQFKSLREFISLSTIVGYECRRRGYIRKWLLKRTGRSICKRTEFTDFLEHDRSHGTAIAFLHKAEQCAVMVILGTL